MLYQVGYESAAVFESARFQRHVDYVLRDAKSCKDLLPQLHTGCGRQQYQHYGQMQIFRHHIDSSCWNGSGLQMRHWMQIWYIQAKSWRALWKHTSEDVHMWISTWIGCHSLFIVTEVEYGNDNILVLVFCDAFMRAWWLFVLCKKHVVDLSLVTVKWFVFICLVLVLSAFIEITPTFHRKINMVITDRHAHVG